jgi:hypothetical protein
VAPGRAPASVGTIFERRVKFRGPVYKDGDVTKEARLATYASIPLTGDIDERVALSRLALSAPEFPRHLGAASIYNGSVDVCCARFCFVTGVAYRSFS